MERYQVGLEDFPGEQIAFIRTLRIIGRISLPDAPRIFDYANNSKEAVLVTGIDKVVADPIAAVFVDARIRVSVRPRSLGTPMIRWPHANTPYKWSGSRRVVAA